jgi:hypothetical protein
MLDQQAIQGDSLHEQRKVMGYAAVCHSTRGHQSTSS